MVDATDMAPLTLKVGAYDVQGVNLKTVLNLVGRFPQLKAAFDGTASDVNELIVVAGDAIAPVIAAGTGRSEEWAERLDIETQIDLLAAIARLTFPKGIAPFVEKVATLINGLATGPSPSQPSKTTGISLKDLPKASKRSSKANA